MKKIKVIKKYFTNSAAKTCAAFIRKQLRENADGSISKVKVCRASEYSSLSLRKELGGASANDYIVVVIYDEIKNAAENKCVTKNFNNMSKIKNVPAEILRKETRVIKMIPIMTFIRTKGLNRNFDYSLFSSREVLSFYKRESGKTAA